MVHSKRRKLMSSDFDHTLQVKNIEVIISSDFFNALSIRPLGHMY